MIGVLRLDVPIQIILARHTLCAPLDRAHELICIDLQTKLPLVRLGQFVAFEILPGILAISKVCVTRLAFVRFVFPQVQSIEC